MKSLVHILFAVAALMQSASSVRPHVSGETQAKPQRILITGYNVQEPAEERLIAVASANHIPLGIVLNAQLCQARLKDMKGSVSVDKLAEIVSRDVPGYQAAIRQGVLMFTPRTPQGATQELLSLVLPVFNTDAHDTHKSAGVALHTYVRAQLVPNEDSTYEILGSFDEPTIDPIHLKDVTVETVLNYIATRSPGAVWIMTPIDQQWMSRADTMSFNIQGYPSKPSSIRYMDYCSSLGEHTQMEK